MVESYKYKRSDSARDSIPHRKNNNTTTTTNYNTKKQQKTPQNMC